MKLKPVFTTFVGSYAKVDTIADLRSLSQKFFNGVSWQTVAKRFAKRNGGHHVLLSCGALRVYTRTDDGKVRQATYKFGTWGWQK